MGHPDEKVEKAAQLLNQIIDASDGASMIGEDEDGTRVEVDLKTGEVTEEKNDQ